MKIVMNQRPIALPQRPIAPPQLSFAVLALALVASACGANYDPPSLIVPDKVRVLGIQAEPPAITMAAATTMTLLEAGLPEGTTLCYAWAFCPFTWSKDGVYGCIDSDLLQPLGNGATSQVGFSDVLASLANAPTVFSKLGLQMPSSSGSSTTDVCKPTSGGGFDTSSLPDSYILFQVADASLYAGQCPDVRTALGSVCSDRQKCIQGYKRLAIAASPPGACPTFAAASDKNCAVADPCDTKQVCGCDGRTYDTDCDRVAAKVSKRSDGACPDQNPALTGVALYWPLNDGALEPMGSLADTGAYTVDTAHAGAIGWPEDVTIVMHPGDSIQLLPQWPASAKEYIGKSADPTAPPVYETLLFSWFTTGGSWNKDRSYDAYPENVFTAPGLDDANQTQDLTLWLVVRDGRNGTAWLQRHVQVTKAAGDPLDQVHPLCRQKPALPGCPAK
jgi:hypothetical protein